MDKPKIIALIPARGGSKSIPDKNIRDFAGKPLIVHSIELALSSSSIDRTIVSTDSQRIAKIAKEAGAEVPFFRPAEYAQDLTPDLPVFVHCLEWLKTNEGYVPDIIVHLRPTSPLRTKDILEEAIRLLINTPKADCVRTVSEPSQCPFKMWTIKKDGLLDPFYKGKIVNLKEPWNEPRQLLPKVYWHNGYADVIRTSTILKKKSMAGDKIMPLVMDNKFIIDINHEIEFQFAENIYRNQKGASQ